MKKRSLDELRNSRTISAIYNYKINRVKRKGGFIGKHIIKKVIKNIKDKKRKKEESYKSNSADMVKQSKIYFQSLVETDQRYLKFVKNENKRRIGRKTGSMIDLKNKISIMKSMNQMNKLCYLDDVVAAAMKNKKSCQFENSKTTQKKLSRSSKGFRRLKRVVSMGEGSLFFGIKKGGEKEKMVKTATEKNIRVKREPRLTERKGNISHELSLIDFDKRKVKSFYDLNMSFQSQNKRKSNKRKSKSVLFDPSVSFNYQTFIIGKKKAKILKEKNKIKTNVEIIDDERPKNMTTKKFRKAQIAKMKEIFLKSYKRKVKDQSNNYKISLDVEKKKMKMFQDTLSKRNISLTKGRREMKAYLVKSSFLKQSKKELDDYKDYAKKFKNEFHGYMDLVGIGSVSQYRKSKFQKFLRFHKGLVHGYRFVDNPDYNQINLDKMRQFKEFTKEGDVEKMIGGFK